MWYEILPSLGMMYFGVVGIGYTIPICLQRYYFGVWNPRTLETNWQRTMWARDDRINPNGWCYRKGLDSIPDED